jgi:hypothetical protein
MPPAYVAWHWQAVTTNRVIIPARQTTLAGGIDSLESIPGLLKRLQIRVQPFSQLGSLRPSIVSIFHSKTHLKKVFFRFFGRFVRVCLQSL